MTDFSALHVALSGLRAARYGTETGSRDVSDAKMDSRLRTISAGACEVSARSKFLERAELVMGEPDHGISTELGRLFVAFEDLGLDPSSTAYRVAALEQLEILTTRVNGVYKGIEDLRADAMRL